MQICAAYLFRSLATTGAARVQLYLIVRIGPPLLSAFVSMYLACLAFCHLFDLLLILLCFRSLKRKNEEEKTYSMVKVVCSQTHTHT